MSTLREISTQLADIVRIFSPSLVAVQSGRCTTAGGVVWAPQRVVTAASRLAGEHQAEVVFGTQRRTGRVLGSDPASDLAVLEVDGELEVPRQRSEPVLVGEIVLALGRGSDLLARLGVISRAAGEWRVPGGTQFERYIEPDIAPSVALGGGALVDSSGSVIGINNVSLARSRLITIPAESVNRIVAVLEAHGRMRRARLGVSVQGVDLGEAIRRETKQERGLIVLSVQPSSPADSAGLLQGDVVLRLGQTPLERVEDLHAALSCEVIDVLLPITAVRAGKLLQLSVAPTSAP